MFHVEHDPLFEEESWIFYLTVQGGKDIKELGIKAGPKQRMSNLERRLLSEGGVRR